MTMTPKGDSVKREALLVLGMHRSGTSAVSGLLVRLGADGPKTLMPADASNPSGYWESTEFCEFHERLLRMAGSRWDAYTRLDTDGLPTSISADLREECRRVLGAEFGESPRFVLKDPRMCRFVPFWLHLLESEGIAPMAVLVVRSPMEVARSLAARNGCERDLSLLIWLRHVLDAEFHTRGIRRTFVRYEDVLKDWRMVVERISSDLEVPWRFTTPADEAETDRFVNSGLRHYREDLEAQCVAPVLAEWLRRTSAALQRLHSADPGDAAALADLDAVRLEFDRATSALGDVGDRIRGGLEAEVGTFEARVGDLEAEVRTFEAQVGNLQAHIGQLEAKLGDLEAEVGNLEAVRVGLQEAVAAQEQQTEDRQRRVQAVEQDKVALQRELSVAQQEAQALRESASWQITAPLRALYRLFQ